MFDKNKVKLGIAPIAWTNDDMPDLGKENTFEQCVSEMALAVSQVPRLVTNIRKIRKFSRKLLNSAVLRSVTSGFQASLSPNHLRKLRKSSVHSLLS